MQDTAAVVFCPECLILSGLVMMDDSIRRLQNFLCGTVILLQLNYGCIGKILFKIQNIADIRAAPAIDGLVVVAHHAQVAAFTGNQAHQLILGVVGILIFIHMHILKAALIVFQHRRMLHKQLQGFDQQIVKIQRVGGAQALLITGHHIVRFL